MPDIAKLRAAWRQCDERENERRRADKARLRKLRRAGDHEALANELKFQMKERFAQTEPNPREKKLEVELQNVRAELSNTRYDLFSLQLEKQSLQSEVLALRAALGERDGVIELSGAVQTSKTISDELTALGFAVTVRTVQSWLKQFYDAKKSGLHPTRYRFEGNERGRAEVSAFTNWCKITRKLPEKRPKTGSEK